MLDSGVRIRSLVISVSVYVWTFYGRVGFSKEV